MPSSTSNAISPEAGAWDHVRAGWRQLYGSFDRLGLSVEHHEFKAPKRLDWGRSFHDKSVEVCLNLMGEGVVADTRSRQSRFQERTVGFYCNGRKDLKASREGGQTHAFITMEMSRAFVELHLEPSTDALLPEVVQWLKPRASRGAAGQVLPMTSGVQSLFLALGAPPVPVAAYPLWYQSKALEMLSQLLFTPTPTSELFCQRHKRLARERVERVVAILRNSYAEPPELEMLGREVGCSPFYLSRIFSKETGMTLSQFVREVRMQRAAELLLTGTHNVTEAAMEVGYSSLSHFSKAFCQSIGCCPTLFPNAKALIEKFHARRQAGW